MNCADDERTIAATHARMPHRLRRAVAIASVAAICGISAHGQPAPPFVGSEFDYTVAASDTWQSIASRFGMAPATLAALNGRALGTRLGRGEQLRVDARHLIPAGLPDGIVINIPQRMLFLKEAGAVVAAYPVGLGRPDWPTFTGSFRVTTKEVDPVWDVPPSIQEELRRAGKTVVTRVPPGPRNPLGKYWLGLSAANYGIHGTVAPSSIFRFESHGCIRLHPDDIEDLWHRVAVGTAGESRYERVLLATGDRLLLEVHPDVYRQAPDAERLVHDLARAAGALDRLDRVAARKTIAAAEGRPQDVTMVAPAR